MSVRQLHEVLTGRVEQSEVDWVASALPSHRRSLDGISSVDCDVTRELTTTLHVVRTHAGATWLAATDLYRLHAVRLPDGEHQASYQQEGETWARYPARIDTQNLIPYIQARETEAPIRLEYSPHLAAAILEVGETHPTMVVCFAPTETWCFESLGTMADCKPIKLATTALQGHKGCVALQLPVIAPSLEQGLLTWEAPDPMGPFRAVAGDRLAVTIGVKLDPADLAEAVAS